MTSPEGLKQVLAQNTYDFVKPHLLRAMVGKILGYGLLLSEGDVHKVVQLYSEMIKGLTTA